MPGVRVTFYGGPQDGRVEYYAEDAKGPVADLVIPGPRPSLEKALRENDETLPLQRLEYCYRLQKKPGAVGYMRYEYVGDRLCP